MTWNFFTSRIVLLWTRSQIKQIAVVRFFLTRACVNGFAPREFGGKIELRKQLPQLLLSRATREPESAMAYPSSPEVSAGGGSGLDHLIKNTGKSYLMVQ